jgi:hypothetical protein
MTKNHHLKDTEHKLVNIILHISYFLQPDKSSDFRNTKPSLRIVWFVSVAVGQKSMHVKASFHENCTGIAN